MKRHLPFALILFAMTSAFAALPSVPGTNEVVRYEYAGYYEQYSPEAQYKLIPRERGDALLSALDGGRQLQEIPPCPPDMICDPAPPRYSLNIILTNGITNTIGISDNFVVLPHSQRVYYGLTDAASEKVAKVIKQLDEDLRQEIVNTPKPLVYTVGTVDDGGTLSGIARLFYGDASKWKIIYEANRQIIKNPNILSGREKLTIPKLQR
jgi:nucleoid-associated protein YgaU